MPRNKMPSYMIRTLIGTLLLVCASPLAAKKNVLELALEFTPQQSVGTAEVEITEAMLDNAVALRVRDARPGDRPEAIGTRTDDDDRRGRLTATNDVGAFVSEHCAELAADWGIQVDDGSGLVLDVALISFKVTETNQAVGATYEAETRFSAKLLRGGSEVWSGTARGDATRYGQKFSNANVNEVLSDALLEAFATLLSSPGLHGAWDKQ